MPPRGRPARSAMSSPSFEWLPAAAHSIENFGSNSNQVSRTQRPRRSRCSIKSKSAVSQPQSRSSAPYSSRSPTPPGGVWTSVRSSRDRHTPLNDYLPLPHPVGCHDARRAAKRARLWGRSAPRRRPKGGEERRVPAPRFVVQRGGRGGERGIRTLGRLLTYARLASGRGCPHRPVLGLRPARFLPPPNSVLAAEAAAARGMEGGRRGEARLRHSQE